MTMHWTRILASGALVCLLAASTASAQVAIEKRRPVPAKGEVCIENAFGSVVVRGWDRKELLVQGELAAGAEDLDVDWDDEQISIDVDIPESWFYASDDDTEYRTRLEVFVPSGYHVCVETLNASVKVDGTRGEVEVDTVNGEVEIGGTPRAVEVETMTGSVTVRADGAPMEVTTINGDVRLTGVRRELSVETVAGTVQADGRDLQSVEVQTTSGDVTLSVSLTERAELEIESFSGTITLTLPSTVQAEFELETFSGTIQSALGPKPSRESRFSPYERLRFATADNETEVEIRTHDGDIVLRTGGGSE